MDILSEQPPNDKFKKDCNIYYRPGRADLIDYLFMKNQDFFEIGVWYQYIITYVGPLQIEKKPPTQPNLSSADSIPTSYLSPPQTDKTMKALKRNTGSILSP